MPNINEHGWRDLGDDRFADLELLANADQLPFHELNRLLSVEPAAPIISTPRPDRPSIMFTLGKLTASAIDGMMHVGMVGGGMFMPLPRYTDTGNPGEELEG